MTMFVHICVAAILFLSISGITEYQNSAEYHNSAEYQNPTEYHNSAEYQNSEDCTHFDRNESTGLHKLLPEGVLNGTKVMTIRGIAKSSENYFILAVHGNISERFFQWQMTLRQNAIYFRNDTMKWQIRRVAPNVLFRANEQFKFDVFKDNKDLVILANGSLVARFLLNNRTYQGDDYTRPAYNIVGNIVVDSVCFQDDKPLPASAEPEYQNSENCSNFGRDEREWTSQIALLHHGFKNGIMVMSIRGSVRSEANNFTLNFQGGDGKIFFQWLVDLKNSLIQSSDNLESWRDHSVYPNVLFRAGDDFKLDIFKDKNHFLILLNDSTVARFLLNERADLNDASTKYHIFGDLFVDSVCFKGYKLPEKKAFSGSVAAQAGCSIAWINSPLYGIPLSELSFDMLKSSTLTIFMRLYIYDNVFAVTLADANQKPVLQLTFRPEMKNTVIDVGSHLNTVGRMPLKLGIDQEIKIINSGKKFEIYLNERLWHSALEATTVNIPRYVEIHGSGLISGLCTTHLAD